MALLLEKASLLKNDKPETEGSGLMGGPIAGSGRLAFDEEHFERGHMNVWQNPSCNPS